MYDSICCYKYTTVIQHYWQRRYTIFATTDNEFKIHCCQISKRFSTNQGHYVKSCQNQRFIMKTAITTRKYINIFRLYDCHGVQLALN